MACNCKHMQQEIEEGKQTIAKLRELFIKRMTVDSDHNDARRRDFNQAIFHVEPDEEIDRWNAECEKYGLRKKRYGHTYACWAGLDMDMVLRCFDDAVKDWRRTFCDVENCRRKP